MPKLPDTSALPMSALEVLVQLTQIARGDIGEFIDDHGRITLAGGNTHLVKRYKKRGNTTTIELYSKLDALVMLAKYHRLIERYQRRSAIRLTVNMTIAERNVTLPNHFAKYGGG